MDLFDTEAGSRDRVKSVVPSEDRPLADRMRPARLEEVVGQEELIGPGRPLRAAIESDRIHSMILWGPPGSGKTTLARLIARLSRSQFIAFSAVLSGIKEIREVMQTAERYRRAADRRTLLFIDEIHRFNKAQQDAFLPFVEEGIITLVGATTQNPSFEINAALLSRCRVYVLRSLAIDEITVLLRRALKEDRALAEAHALVEEEDLRFLAALSGGDARRALSVLEHVVESTRPDRGGSRRIVRAMIERSVQRAPLLYDRAGDAHFDQISALHKSLRNSDADAAAYWLVRMLESGEDPLYVARRMVRFASEDVGNADPHALSVALAAKGAFEFLGSPEGDLALVQAAIYLAVAPKSNAIDEAYNRIREDLRTGSAEPVPMALRNAPTGLMKNLGHGRGYEHAHDHTEGTTDMECLPERLRGRCYYQPRPVGREAEIIQRLVDLKASRERMRAKRTAGEEIRRPPTRAPRL